MMLLLCLDWLLVVILQLIDFVASMMFFPHGCFHRTYSFTIRLPMPTPRRGIFTASESVASCDRIQKSIEPNEVNNANNVMPSQSQYDRKDFLCGMYNIHI